MEIAVLRLLHIVFGILWAGGAVIVGFWVTPSVIEAGPGGGPVMGGIMMKRKLPPIMTMAGLITVLCGLRLYMLKFSSAWVTTPEGIVLTLGGLLAIAGLIMGVFVMRPVSMKLAALGAEIAASGGPPSAEQGKQMGELQARMQKLGKVLGAHLGASVILMASMRLAQVLGS